MLALRSLWKWYSLGTLAQQPQEVESCHAPSCAACKVIHTLLSMACACACRHNCVPCSTLTPTCGQLPERDVQTQPLKQCYAPALPPDLQSAAAEHAVHSFPVCWSSIVRGTVQDFVKSFTDTCVCMQSQSFLQPCRSYADASSRQSV